MNTNDKTRFNMNEPFATPRAFCGEQDVQMLTHLDLALIDLRLFGERILGTRILGFAKSLNL